MVVKAWIQEQNVVPGSLREWLVDQRLITNGTAALVTVPDIAMATPIIDKQNSGLFYNSLPLTEPKSRLPVSIHGRFAVSQDRRSLRTNGLGGNWNKTLARDYLPRLYFVFLENLKPNLQNVNFDVFWPESPVADNEISSFLRNSFWNLVPSSPQKIVRHPTNINVPFSLAIFDTRNGVESTDPIRALVKTRKPSHDKSIALYRVLMPDNGDYPTQGFNYLTPTLVLNLLREDSVVNDLNSINDDDLNSILIFALGEQPRSTEILEGCYLFRLSDGTIPKVDRNRLPHQAPRTLFFVDAPGYNLFKIRHPSLIQQQCQSLNIGCSHEHRNIE